MNPPAAAHTRAPGALNALFPWLFVALWSTGFIGAKWGLPYAPALTFLALRFAIVSVLMLGVAWWFKAPWPRSGRQWLHIAVSGLLVHGVYLGGVFMAIGHGLPSGITALVVGLQPLLTALAAGLLLGERVRPAQWCGLALGFAGVSLVVSQKIAQVPAGDLLAMLVPAVVALVGITCGTLYQKRFCPSFDLRSGSVIQYVPCMAALALVASQTESMQVQWTGSFVFALAWLVLVLSVGAVSLLNLLISQGSAVNVASLFYLTPPATALIAWALFSETLSGLALVGMAVAVTGVWLARQGR
jgi:drug/metabolite transporter (DMT)-like permease